MNINEIKSIFLEKFKGKNLMTPHIIRYGKSGPYIYELSEGEGFKREPIYGVTVLTLDGERRTELDKCLESLGKAENYTNLLKSL